MNINRFPLLLASAFLLAACANSSDLPKSSSSDGLSSEVSSDSSEETMKYTIVFDLNGGASASYVSSKTVEALSSSDFFFDCRKAGYNFRGWSYNGIKIFDETGKMLISPTMEATMTFVAVFANDAKMTITTNMEEAGTVKGEGYYEYNTDVSVLAEPKQGYNFLGWYDADGIPLSSQKSYNYRMSESDITIEARFELATFEFNIKSNNDGLGVVCIDPTASTAITDYGGCASKSVVYTNDVKIAANTKTDVRFLGWFDEDSTLVSTNPVYSFTMPNHDYYLEAKWNSFAINYDAAGGTNSSSNPSSVSTEQEASLSDPYREGYTFKGWYDKTTGEKITNIALGTLNDIDLVARWEAISYSITYELNGGENASGNPETYTIEDDIVLGNPTKAGYRFDGWFEDASLSTKVSYIPKGSIGDRTFYSKWTAISYAITYELGGGTNSVENPGVFTVEDSVQLKSPARKGHDFKGWYKDDGFSESIDEIPAGTIGNQIVYAKWEAIQYAISYQLGGGENSSDNPTFYTIEDSVLLSDPVRPGYSFAGWYSGEAKISSIEKGTTGEISLEARWTTNVYNITYNLNGGENAADNPATFTTEDPVDLKAASRTGYDFKGWYFDPELTDKIESIPAGTVADIALYAKWEIIDYAITYDLNGGENASENPSYYTIEDEITLSNPTKSGYTFIGWFRNEDQITSIEKGSTGSVTIEARWTTISYEITYHLNGGANDASNPSTFTTETTFTFKSPSRDGYNFAGWYTDSGFSKKIVAIEPGVINSLDLFAKWAPIEYSITYELNGGTNAGENPKTYTIEDDVDFVDPSRDGYNFTGWYKNDERITSLSRGTTGDIKLSARWSVITYSIAYNLENGTNAAENPSTYTTESKDINLADPTKDGYTFKGWYSDSSYLNKIEIIVSGSFGDLNLYAKWSPNEHNLSAVSSDTSKGTVSVVGEGATDEKITLTASPVGDCVFKGWYEGENLVCDNCAYEFVMPNKDVSLTALFWTKAQEDERKRSLGMTPTVSEDGKTLTYGLYPQKHVSDTSLIQSLNALSTDNDNEEWCLFEGTYYVKAVAQPYKDTYTFDDGDTIVEGEEYWFRCDPITWNILTDQNNSYLLVSSVLLDSHRFNSWFSGTDDAGYYANNYARSEIRSWLNGYFLETAFALDDSYIEKTVVDNSVESTGDTENIYTCEDTTDKVFLLSNQDFINAEYGFETGKTAQDVARKCKTTDWARAKHAMMEVTGSLFGNGWYLTRSPSPDSTYSASRINYYGWLDDNGTLGSGFSVRPAIKIHK